jgi:ankyrin repeat protein
MSFILTIVLSATQAAAGAAAAPPTDRQRLQQSSNKGELNVVEELLTAHPEWVDATDDQGVSFMLNALYRRRTEVVAAYVRRRKTFNLFEASALGRARDIEILLQKDPGSVTSYSGDGFIALGLASFFAQPEAVRVLLAHGADINQYARVPHVQGLHSAAAGKCIECVRLLLDAGADPNAPQDDGFRAIHEAGANDDRAMAELLISRGARPDIKDDKGKTAADLARERGHAEIATWLESLRK